MWIVKLAEKMKAIQFTRTNLPKTAWINEWIYMMTSHIPPPPLMFHLIQKKIHDDKKINQSIDQCLEWIVLEQSLSLSLRLFRSYLRLYILYSPGKNE